MEKRSLSREKCREFTIVPGLGNSMVQREVLQTLGSHDMETVKVRGVAKGFMVVLRNGFLGSQTTGCLS